MPCVYQGDKFLCLVPLGLYFSLFMVMQEIVSLKALQGSALLLTGVMAQSPTSLWKCNRNGHWFSVSNYPNSSALGIESWTDFCFSKTAHKELPFGAFIRIMSVVLLELCLVLFSQSSASWCCVSAVCFALICCWEPLSLLPLHYHYICSGKPCDWMNQYHIWPDSRGVEFISTNHRWKRAFPLFVQICPKLSLSIVWDSVLVVSVFSSTQKNLLIQICTSLSLSEKIPRADPNRGK